LRNLGDHFGRDTIDQNEFLNPVGMPEGEGPGDATAHRVTDQAGPLDAGQVHELPDRVDEQCRRVLHLRTIGVAVPEEVWDVEAILPGQRPYLLFPDPDLPSKAVEQQDRRPFADDGVEKGPLLDLRRLELEGGVPLKGGRPDERSATPNL
jgi:hypothetical protein